MQRDQLELRYLPRFDVSAEQLHGFEAQTFWHHPEKGELGGADFMPVAETSGQLEELGTWMLINVCEEAATWPSAVSVSIAVSPRWFNSSFLINQVQEALETSGLAPHRLTLEVAEGVLLADHKTVASTLHALKDLGVRINIDKFGTSIASLREVLDQPFDGIRFDRNILTQLGLEDDKEGVLAMIRLSRSVGLMVTAEGIENARQFSQLRNVSCDHVQGPTSAPPWPARKWPRSSPRQGGCNLFTTAIASKFAPIMVPGTTRSCGEELAPAGAQRPQKR
ncbi:EAL domain-containing protein [Pseudomonas sp. NA13]